MAENSADNKPQETEQQDLLTLARTQFKQAAEAEREIREAALEDIKFCAGDQWPEEVKKDRAQDGRPCLTINRMPQFKRQITNDQRQNRPAIKVHPVDDNGDPETAKVIQELIRHIEYNSNAEAAYDTAFDFAVGGGFGFYRVVTEYADAMSFDQEILIKRIRDPFTVYKDPASQEPDGSDMTYAFVVEDLTSEEYKERFPKSKVASLEDFGGLGVAGPDWMQNGKVRIAEWFRLVYEEKEIYLLANGTVTAADEFKKFLASQGLKEAPEGAIKDKRTAKVPVVKWKMMNGIEFLEERDWIGKYIPIIPVIGEEIYVDGKLTLKGIVRDSKDSQRMYNYMKSSEAETIALAPRAPYIGAEGQFKGKEAAWRTAHKKNHAYLEYVPVSHAGNLAPPPQRQVYEPAIQAITMAGQAAAEDLKATTGIYDAALGGRSNETSGIAIQRRNQQAQTSNFHFVDNLTRSLRHTGRILVDLIPKVYDAPRAARIIGEDGQQEVIRLNEPFQHRGEQKLYDVTTGQYDVVIEVGPSYATKRQEAVAVMMELSAKVPQIAQGAMDLLVGQMDIPNSQELKERLRKMLPPGLADDKDQKPVPPEVQAQMQQQMQMIEGLTEANKKLLDEREMKIIEIESKERIVAMQEDTKIALKRAEIDAQDARLLLEIQTKEINERQALLNANKPVEYDFSEGAQMEMPQQMPTGGPSPGNSMEMIHEPTI